MKRCAIVLILCGLLLGGCAPQGEYAQVAATTGPVYHFTAELCRGTGLTVARLVTEEISCLHDYSLNVRQAKAAEAAEVIVISGAGLEEFMEDILHHKQTIDASADIPLLTPTEHSHEADEAGHEDHHHDSDPHIWLSPLCARQMVQNICAGLSRRYPQYKEVFAENAGALTLQLEQLQRYGEQTLSTLACRELITFHDGFAYFADSFDLTILEAVEEESGREASAKELIHLIEEAEHHNLPAIFTEKNGSVSAASIIARETGCGSFTLDMAMTGDSYFDAMYHNIDTIKEALG